MKFLGPDLAKEEVNNTTKGYVLKTVFIAALLIFGATKANAVVTNKCVQSYTVSYPGLPDAYRNDTQTQYNLGGNICQQGPGSLSSMQSKITALCNSYGNMKITYTSSYVAYGTPNVTTKLVKGTHQCNVEIPPDEGGSGGGDGGSGGM